MYGKGDINPIRVDTFLHGLNTTKRPTEVGEMYRQRYPRYHCYDCLDTMLDVMMHRPPVKAITSSISGRIYGYHVYTDIAGTERHLIVVGQKLYKINTTTGALTELFDFGGTGEAWFVDYLDKCWVTNGVKVVKVESDTAYQVGIAAPEGVQAAAAAGGSLAAGTYSVYAGYARKVDSTNILYSKGQLIGSVTLDGGNGTIAITNFANSSDAQVNNKVIWIDDAASGTYYLYHQTDDNSTTSFNIVDTSGKATGSVYSTLASLNDVPGAFEYIFIFDKRLWGIINNEAYYSLQEGNVYDLERCYSQNKITYPFKLKGIIGLNEHLYFNTSEGLIRQPYGSVTARYERIGAGQINPPYFKFMRTVANYNSVLLGVTDKGFKIFDGEKWYGNDLGRDVRPEFKQLFDGADTYNYPCSSIVRAKYRIEYHLAYRDKTVSLTMNNRRLVLNLNALQILDRDDHIAPWEKWSIGANYFAIDNSDNLYCAQSHPDVSVVYKDRSDRLQDYNVYIGDIITSQIPGIYVKSGTIIPSMDGIVTFDSIRSVCKFSNEYSVRIQFINRATELTATTITPTVEGARFGIARFGVDRFSANLDVPQKTKIDGANRGYGFYVEIMQEKEDKKFQLSRLELNGYITKGRQI